MKNIKNKVKDFARKNKWEIKTFAKAFVVVSMVAAGVGHVLLKEPARHSIMDILPEPKEDQTLVVDTAYMNDFGGLNYTLYTDLDKDGFYESYKKVVVGNSPGQYNIKYGKRINKSN